MMDYEQKLSAQLRDAFSAAEDSLSSQGQAASARSVSRAFDELDTAAAAEIARMFKRNLSA